MNTFDLIAVAYIATAIATAAGEVALFRAGKLRRLKYDTDGEVGVVVLLSSAFWPAIIVMVVAGFIVDNVGRLAKKVDD